MEGNTKAQLPDNVEELKGIIVSLQKTIGILEEKVKYFQGMVFGRKSEKFSEEDQGQVVPGTVCDRWVEWNLTGRLVGDCPLIV